MSETMSEAVEFQGIATIRALPACGMITLRGAPDDLSVAAARLGTAAPATLGASLKGGTALLWMSPDEALMLCPSEDVADHVEALTLAYRDRHAMALDVSDARVRFSVSGAHAREVLAKLCALDLSPEGFGRAWCGAQNLGRWPRRSG